MQKQIRHAWSIQAKAWRLAMLSMVVSVWALAASAVFPNAIARVGQVVGAAHLALPGLGQVRRSGTAYDWVPVNHEAVPAP
ncbi:hypothetical protein [Paraburkholderia bryophila]|uniref:hypothetical protein n=1 Tax=Paraburkholderia bryophila TaxID=420952 RepID=UPI003AF04F14